MSNIPQCNIIFPWFPWQYNIMIPLNFHGAPSQAPVWVTLFPDHQWDAGALQKPTSLDIVFSLFLFPSGEWVSRTWPCNFRVGVTLNCTLLGQIAHLLIKYLLPMNKASVSTTTSVGSFYSSRHFHAFSECIFYPSVSVSDMNIHCGLAMKLSFTYSFPSFQPL